MSAPFLSFDREAIYAALFALVTPAYAWKNTPARRVKLWGDVPSEERPAMYQFEGGDETWEWSNTANPKVYLPAALYVYTSTLEGQVGATILNQVLDAVTNRLQPSGAQMMTGRQTLGGLVQWARIQGSVSRVPGDIDGEGMVVIPIKMLMGATN